MAERAAVELMAVRAMIEGAPVTFELMAQATRRSAKALRARARREGWGEPGQIDPATLEERLLVLSGRLVRGLETISANGERDGKISDKAGIDALNAMLRMVEKISEITRGLERAKENQTASDADMASLFKRIDDRIVDLAGQLAGQLVRQEPFARTGTLD